MIELCKINRLKVIRDTPQGLYLADEPSPEADDGIQDENGVCDSSQYRRSNKEEKNTEDKSALNTSAARFTGKKEDVLLPRPEVPEHVKAGDELDVFIYLDSQDRYTATLRTPLIYLGGMAVLKVVQVTDIGVFLDWGLAKNLLLPFKEVVTPLYFDPFCKEAAGNGNNKSLSIKEGRAQLSRDDLEWLAEEREIPVVLYIDKSGRPAATMRVYDCLAVGEKYTKDSAVEATVIQINPRLGVFVAVDDKYFGMININEITDVVNVGDRIFGRISGVRDDGKYMVSLMQKAHLQMDNDAQVIMKRLRDSGGRLALGDKSDAQDIMRELGMSKKAFKRAVGQLYKEGKAVPGAYEIVQR